MAKKGEKTVQKNSIFDFVTQTKRVKSTKQKEPKAAETVASTTEAASFSNIQTDSAKSKRESSQPVGAETPAEAETPTSIEKKIGTKKYVSEALALAVAIAEGDLKRVKKHVKSKGTETLMGLQAENTVMTPLSMAMYYHRSAIINYLVKKGAQANPDVHKIKLPIAAAASFEKVFDIVMDSLEHVYMKRQKGFLHFKPYGAIYWALLKPNFEPNYSLACKLLHKIEEVVDVDDLMPELIQNSELLGWLFDHGLSPNYHFVRYRDGITKLADEIVRDGSVECAELALGSGACIARHNHYDPGHTPENALMVSLLWWLVEPRAGMFDEPEADTQRRLDMAKTLIADSRIDINEVNWIGYPLLVRAILSKDEDFAIYLMKRGANINFKAPEGIPFEYAVGIGCWKVAEKLVEMGAQRGPKEHKLMKALKEKNKEWDVKIFQARMKFMEFDRAQYYEGEEEDDDGEGDDSDGDSVPGLLEV